VVIAENILSFGMSTYTTFDMLITELSTLRLKHLHLRHVLVICQNLLYIFIFGKDISIDGHYDIDRAKKFIEQIQLVHQMVQE
jgi:hypothetical protein